MILIREKILAGMHLRGKSDLDLQENPGRDAFARGKMILIRGKILAGMHLQVRNDPDLQENSGRDAFARGK